MADASRRSPSHQDGTPGSLYQRIGGAETCQRLSERFHDRVAGDPVLRAMFPKNFDALVGHFALFVAEKLGGPADYTAQRGKTSLGCRHAHLPIGETEADRWLGHMFATLAEVDIPEPMRERLHAYFTETAHTLRDPFLPYYALPLEELRSLLEQQPGLATASDRGRTLLGHAALQWDLSRVRLLLERGADANVPGVLDHPPLYQATRATGPGPEEVGRTVVDLLIEYGAKVNMPSGPGQSTALHMTARRGTVPLAEALLNAGAEIESKDTKGETPLRRAVNCVQKEMVRFLLSRGANPLAPDKQGRTALDVARHALIREALLEVTRR